MIVSGELKEGDKLPNQNEFAAQLGVSRPSLREAMQILSQLGAIEQRPGAGTVLVSRAPVLLTQKMELPLISDAEATVELIEARRMVEVSTITLAVAKASDEEVAEIGQALAEMEEAAGRGQVEQFRQADLVFHHLVARAAHNRFVLTVFQNLYQTMKQFIEEAFQAMPHMLGQSLADHQRIYQGLKSRDPQEAGRAMADHILTVEKAMQSYYDSAQGQTDR